MYMIAYRRQGRAAAAAQAVLGLFMLSPTAAALATAFSGT